MFTRLSPLPVRDACFAGQITLPEYLEAIAFIGSPFSEIRPSKKR
jgi:hypothetical protein